MAENKDPIILKFTNCSTSEALQKLLMERMSSAPNIDFLHEILHAAIKSDNLTLAILIAEIITLVAKKKDPKPWPQIISSVKERTTKFSWSKYFATDIKRRKKKNEKLRNESILHLYNKKQLTLFSAKLYPKLFFTLIKLGANPNETKLSTSLGHNINLTVALLKSKKIDRCSRLHIFEFMAKRNLIKLNTIGQKNSPFSFCLTGRLDCLKYLLQAPGIEDVLYENENVIECFGQLRAAKLIKYFTVPQLVKLLSKKKSDGSLVATLIDPVKVTNNQQNFFLAIKEICQNSQMASKLKKIESIGAKTIAFFEGTANTFEDFSGARPKPLAAMTTFRGNTSCNIALLPAELLEMITIHLGANDQARLFGSSKALREKITDYHWRHMLLNENTALYKQLELDTKASWYQKVAPRISASNNWKAGKCTVKKLRMPKSTRQYTPQQLDEYWLTSTMGSQLRLLNVKDGSGKLIKTPYEPSRLEYFNTSPYSPPDFFFRSHSDFGYWIGNKLTTHNFVKMGVDKEQWLTNLSSNVLLVSAKRTFDIERQMIFIERPDVQAFDVAKFNPFTNTILAQANRKLYVLDKSLKTLGETEVFEIGHHYCDYQLDIVDEYTVLSKHKGGSTLLDLRTMKPLLNIPSAAYYNGAGRALELPFGTTPSIVWNLSELRWESAIPLPNGATRRNVVCNSKMVVFPTTVPYALSAMVF